MYFKIKIAQALLIYRKSWRNNLFSQILEWQTVQWSQLCSREQDSGDVISCGAIF